MGHRIFSPNSPLEFLKKLNGSNVCALYGNVLPDLQTPAPRQGEHQGTRSFVLIWMFLRYSKYKYFLLTAPHTQHLSGI